MKTKQSVIRKSETDLWKKLFRGKDTTSISQLDGTGNPIDTIYTEGDTSVLLNPSTLRVAIVGTRDISPYGKAMTERIVHQLSCRKEKPIILSGLALGVDSIAHRAAIEYGVPTVAVLPTHTDNIYPFHNRSIAEKIASGNNGSCLLTQFPQGTAPIAINFLMRNKTLALLSDVVIVVETKKKGGAMLTALYAKDFEIPVLAVPGRIDDIRSQGCNELISNGTAEILTSPNIINVLIP